MIAYDKPSVFSFRPVFACVRVFMRISALMGAASIQTQCAFFFQTSKNGETPGKSAPNKKIRFCEKRLDFYMVKC